MSDIINQKLDEIEKTIGLINSFCGKGDYNNAVIMTTKAQSLFTELRQLIAEDELERSKEKPLKELVVEALEEIISNKADDPDTENPHYEDIQTET